MPYMHKSNIKVRYVSDSVLELPWIAICHSIVKEKVPILPLAYAANEHTASRYSHLGNATQSPHWFFLTVVFSGHHNHSLYFGSDLKVNSPGSSASCRVMSDWSWASFDLQFSSFLNCSRSSEWISSMALWWMMSDWNRNKLQQMYVCLGGGAQALKVWHVWDAHQRKNLSTQPRCTKIEYARCLVLFLINLFIHDPYYNNLRALTRTKCSHSVLDLWITPSKNSVRFPWIIFPKRHHEERRNANERSLITRSHFQVQVQFPSFSQEALVEIVPEQKCHNGTISRGSDGEKSKSSLLVTVRFEFKIFLFSNWERETCFSFHPFVPRCRTGTHERPLKASLYNQISSNWFFIHL